MPKLSMLVLPMMMAPAARSRATDVASKEGTCPANPPWEWLVSLRCTEVCSCSGDLVQRYDKCDCTNPPWSTRAPAVVCSPAVQMLSFTATGTPARGPSCLPPPD